MGLGLEPWTPWIACALVAICLTWILTPHAALSHPPTLDIALIFSSVLALVLLCEESTNSPASHRETFVSIATDQEDDAWLESLVTASAKLVTYVSSFRSDSYPGTDQPPSLWKSVGVGVTGKGPVCHPPASMDFTLNMTQPVWKVGSGFVLSNTVLTGPLSMDVFPSSRPQEYSVFMLFQLSGLPLDGTAATLLCIPANGSPVQNGATLQLTAIGPPTGSSVKADVQLTIGNQPPLTCSDTSDQTVSFDTNARYLITVTRSSTNVRVSLFHVESSSSQCLPNILLNETIADDGLTYNNQAIVINRGRGVSGNIVSFGIFDDALLPQDEASICSHYHDMLLLQDPLVREARAAAAAATIAASCPYDAATCSACVGVTSWSNAFKVANEGGASCLAAIDAHCNSDPTSSGCECYDPANIETQTCQALITAYSGNNTALCALPVQQALAAEENTRRALSEEQAREKREQQAEARALELNKMEVKVAGDAAEKVCTQAKPSMLAWLFGL